METNLTIQQVATLTQLSVHTLRYYERVGLLQPVGRATSGHRRYSAADIARIEFLTRLRTTGMPIRQMLRFSELLRQGDASVSERRALLEAHYQQVRERLQELNQNLAVIEFKIEHYKKLEADQGADPWLDKGPTVAKQNAALRLEA